MTIASPSAFCHGFKGLLLAGLGRLDEAQALVAEGMRLAGEHGDGETVGWSHSFAAWIAYLRGDADAVLAHAQQFVESSERMGGAFSRSWAWNWLGMAEMMRGGVASGRSRRWSSSLRISRDYRSGVEGEASRLIALAESYLGLGDAERARRLVGEALASIAAGRSQRHLESQGQLALARILLVSAGAQAEAEIEAAVARTLELVRLYGLKAYEPGAHELLAGLARELGDEERTSGSYARRTACSPRSARPGTRRGSPLNSLCSPASAPDDLRAPAASAPGSAPRTPWSRPAFACRAPSPA